MFSVWRSLLLYLSFYFTPPSSPLRLLSTFHCGENYGDEVRGRKQRGLKKNTTVGKLKLKLAVASSVLHMFLTSFSLFLNYSVQSVVGQ